MSAWSTFRCEIRLDCSANDLCDQLGKHLALVQSSDELLLVEISLIDLSPKLKEPSYRELRVRTDERPDYRTQRSEGRADSCAYGTDCGLKIDKRQGVAIGMSLASLSLTARPF